MKKEMWQSTKQEIAHFFGKAKHVWKISFEKKPESFTFYQFTEDYKLSESPYLIYSQYSHLTLERQAQLVVRKLELLTASEIPQFLYYHYTRFTSNPLEFLHYSKGLFEGKVQAMLAEDSRQAAPKYNAEHYGVFRISLSWLEYQFQELNNQRLQEAQAVISQQEEEIGKLKGQLAELESLMIEFNPALSDKEVADLFKQLSTLHFADGKPIIVTPHRKLSQFLPLICKPFKDKKGTDSLRNYLSGAEDKQDRYQLPPEKRRIHIIIRNE